MEVEDYLLDYYDFEGIIRAETTARAEVIVWDWEDEASFGGTTRRTRFRGR